MILDATNQKQAINEYAKMGSNGFWGEKYFVIFFWVFFFFCLFLRRNIIRLAGDVYGSMRKQKSYICVFRDTKLPKR